MANTSVKSFSDIQGLTVSVPSLGKTVGVVEDIYFKPGSNAIDSLRVRTPLAGYKMVPVRAVLAIGSDTVSIINEQMLTTAVPPFPLISSLRANKVVSNKGDEMGQVGEVLLAVTPSQSMHIAGIEVSNGNSRRSSTINAAAIGHYRPNVIVIDR